MKIILASGSPRRKELFKDIYPDFEIIVSGADETLPEKIIPAQVAEYLSNIKASDVAKTHPDDIVIGCDTVVIKDEKILGKPNTKNDAVKMMQLLSGETHQVITGCSIYCKNKHYSFHETTFVTFYPMSEQEIDDYTNSSEPYDKAGGYGIQGKAKVFIKKIEGDYFNVVGLPVARLKKELEKIIKNAD